ncbi:transmembrane-type terpene cyclase [Corallococcus llansteffanensis]|uniref:Uncharacterized protein n=1 Tax=Corallococcus llansteffanensis TaxID=2316731 RepID=A0A3A8Q988_9BACT|nr:hypothetical protein [Corallococcus llansteffanensis]RKH65186.1 hypothetical protein D7V93_06375 [Corallococcus llansteffanensis]
MHPLYSLRGIDPHAFNAFSWWNLLGVAGCVLWVVAYVLIIRQCAREKTYGVPLLAICLNFTWECIAAWIAPNPVPLWSGLDRAWFFLDLIIVWQLLRYGRAEQTRAELRRYFYPVVALTLVLAFFGQYTFIQMYKDILGFMTAFIINLVMSVLFVGMYFERAETRRGLSVPVAWLKLLGTLATGIECHILVRQVDLGVSGVSFLTFLSVTIFLFDGLYLYLVMKPVTVPGLAAAQA